MQDLMPMHRLRLVMLPQMMPALLAMDRRETMRPTGRSTPAALASRPMTRMAGKCRARMRLQAMRRMLKQIRPRPMKTARTIQLTPLPTP